MRLRNKKGAHDIIGKCSYIVEKPEQYRKNFKNLFENDACIEIEIGMGKGDFIINKAILNPDVNFIGIEKYATVLVSAVKKLENLELKNLKIINMDANFIDDVFENEIDKIYLNFSDPWPKKKHSSRRLTSPIFISKYNKIFKNNRIIEMKTDNRNLFEYSIVSLTNNGYVIDDINLDLHALPNEDNVMTEYEKKFVSLGNTIYKMKAVHNVDNNK